ncbi:hypothetical protein TNCV_965031 [Trichonephila clavipes]|nr:hypothetical protein TNCV_965031 [Trichonephila clavipes]
MLKRSFFSLPRSSIKNADSIEKFIRVRANSDVCERGDNIIRPVRSFPTDSHCPTSRRAVVDQWSKSCQACHEFERSTTKDPPCRAAMLVKYVENWNVPLVLDESRSFFRVHTGYFSNIPKCIKAEFIASWACSQSSVVSSSKR